MIDLKNEIKKIIDTETNRIDEKTGEHHFTVLNEKSVDTIDQIVRNFKLESDFNDLPKKGELIFVAAPTGAGKDGLVTSLKKRNPEKKYVELNMDMFRHYLNLLPDSVNLNDQDFANQTNELSYEIYYTIQNLILTDFPGTNVIITGTLRTTDWVEKTFKAYKENEKTDYTTNIATLAVPKKDSQFSILKRYVKIVDTGVRDIDEDGNLMYSSNFTPGTARYTSCEYHDETYDTFPERIKYFLDLMQEGKYIDSASVYKRSRAENNFDEDTLVMYSKPVSNASSSLLGAIEDLRGNDKSQITDEDVNDLFNLVKQKKNIKYFKEQGILKRLLDDMSIIFKNPDFMDKVDKLLENENIKDDNLERTD